MNMNIILILAFLIAVPRAHADRIIVGPMNNPFYDIYRPQTREEIYSSYRALVEKRDGVSELEARLIAQYELATRELEHGYQIAKPKVIAETESEWTVRFPSSFSINDHKLPPDFLVVIDKKNGRILSLGPKKD